jgi:cobalt/nickel transport system permease protein
VARLCNHSLDLTGLAGDENSPVHRRDPRAKLLGLFGVTLVAVSASPADWPVWVACAGVLLTVTAIASVPVQELWRRGKIIIAPVLIVALVVPLVRRGGAEYGVGPFTVHEAGLRVLAGVAAKASIGTFAAVLFSCTTSYPAALRGLEALRVPRVFVLIAGLMYRYLFVLVEELARLRSALTARAYRPRHLLQAAAMGRVATSLFLRSHARGERVYLAMLARGYTGRMPYLDSLAFARADAVFVVLVAVAVLPLRAVLAL